MNPVLSPEHTHTPQISTTSLKADYESACSSTKSVPRKRKFWSKLFLLLPLLVHCLLSVAIAVTLTNVLNGHHFCLERSPELVLANGTSMPLDGHRLLQSDVVTILSTSLALLRWITAGWTGPLCWRVMFLLAGTHGLTRREINWVVSYGVLPPLTHFHRPAKLILGIVLLATVITFPASPLLTGCISWVPSSSNVTLGFEHTISYNLVNTSVPPVADPVFQSTFSTNVVGNINAAWGKKAEINTFKRVVPSVAALGVNSTVGKVPIAYYTTPTIEWIPDRNSNLIEQLNSMLYNNISFPNLHLQIQLPGAIVLIVNSTRVDDETFEPPPIWQVAINVSNDKFLEVPDCNNFNATLLPNGTHIRSYLFSSNFTASNINTMQERRAGTQSHSSSGSTMTRSQEFTSYYCLAFANVSYLATYGSCEHCLVSSYTVVQNQTKLELAEKIDDAGRAALKNMPQITPRLTPLRNSLPDAAIDVEEYMKALLSRTYSSLWTVWTDVNSEDTVPSMGRALRRKGAGRSNYTPAYPTLQAQVRLVRVYWWLTIQLLVVVAAVVFLWLQFQSPALFIEDTDMVALDVDSTTAPLPEYSSKDDLKAKLWIEADEFKGVYGWRLTPRKSE